jgi:hypothetical protein
MEFHSLLKILEAQNELPVTHLLDTKKRFTGNPLGIALSVFFVAYRPLLSSVTNP